MDYRCEECGAELDDDYCPYCEDDAMVVEVKTNRPPQTFGGTQEVY